MIHDLTKQKIKTLMKEKLTEDMIDAIMTEEKEMDAKLVLKGDTIKKYFPKEYTPMQMQQVITKLLENWYRKRTQDKER